jgi:hypothetical protein
MLVVGQGLILLAASAGISRAHAADYVVYLAVVFKNYVKGFTIPGFESGTQGWSIQSNQGGDVVTAVQGNTGQWSAGLGNGAANRVASISQTVKDPRGAYAIQYYLYIDFPINCPEDFRLMVFIDDAPYKHYQCTQGDKASWSAQDFHLSHLKGMTIDIKLEFQSGSGQDLYLYLDDFAFQLE